jgi:hypothetical protein
MRPETALIGLIVVSLAVAGICTLLFGRKKKP